MSEEDRPVERMSPDLPVMEQNSAAMEILRNSNSELPKDLSVRRKVSIFIPLKNNNNYKILVFQTYRMILIITISSFIVSLNN